MRKFFLLTLLLSVVCFMPVLAQDITVSGKVVDSSGTPIIGAAVKAQGEKTGVITDKDGNFKIVMPKGKNNLVVSYLGYKEMIVQAILGKLLNIKMKEDAQNLDELVVVGYGTQKKSALTSSIETVKGEDLLRMPTPNLDQALNGQVAGLQVMSLSGDPGAAREATIRIRAMSGAVSSPLLVIDGIPRFSENTTEGEQRLSDLNPDDIESISILKDAAAAAVYGVRAANGVILVKTKRASGDSKVRVNYRGQFNIQEATQFPHFLKSYEYAKLYNKAVEGARNAQPYTEEELELIRTQSMPNKYADTNLLDYLKSHGTSSTNAVSLSGGNKFVRYYISGAYTNTVGLYSGVGRDRFNYAAKLDATLAKGLTLSLDMSGVRSEYKNTSYTTIDAAYSYAPTQPFVYDNGDLASIGHANPLISVRGLGGYKQMTTKMNTVTANLKWELPWVKGLSVYGRVTVDNNSSLNKNYNNPVTLYLYNEKNKEITVDKTTIYPKAKVSVYQGTQFVDNALIEFGANYDRTFGGKHHVTGLIVANYQSYKRKSMDGTNNDLPGLYPEVLGSTNTGTLHGVDSEVQRASLIGRATYGFSNRYFAEFSFRMDGSAKFHPDHRWAFFPTVSASWILSNEEFFKSWRQKVLSNVKFRLSTGLLGRDGSVQDYSYLLKYIYSPAYGYNVGGVFKPAVIVATGNYPNTRLSWEKNRDYNVGIDLGFWDNRFGLTYEYYVRYRTDMLTPAPDYLYPASTGTNGSVPLMNFGKLKAWGWDLTLTHRNSINKFRYDAALTLSLGRDEVIDWGDESKQLENMRRKGQSTGTTWMYESLGLFQTQEEIDNWKLNQDGTYKGKNKTIKPGDIKYKDQNDDGVLDDKDLKPFRDSQYPDFTGSLRLGASYKGFFVSVMFQRVAGFKQYVSEMYSLENSSLPKFQDYHLTDCWTPDNPNASFPRVKLATARDNNRKKSSFWVRDNSFVRLKSVSVGYSLPSSVLSKLKLSSLSISLMGGNLYTWSKLKYMDPESMRGYPIQRTYGINANIGF